MAELTDLEPGDIAPVWVSKPANMDVRLGQPGSTGRKLGIAICDTQSASSDRDARILAEKYMNRGRVAVGADLVACLAVAVRVPSTGSWELAAVIERPGGDFGERLRHFFPQAQLLAPEAATQPGQPSAEQSALPLAPASSSDLAETLFVDDEWIDDVLWSLHDKRAIVLYGPPGTGKTFIARKLAEHLQPDRKRRERVQLHPSYTYEDFFEGYRPAVVKGSLTLVLRSGPLRELAARAAAEPSQPYVMLLDELNRANLARVFGELFFLLEYRNESVRLMYSPGEFALPPNIFFIATMNTADRSIALVDQALRRRFYFHGLFPGEPPVAGMLERYLREHRPGMVWVASLLSLANEKLNDRDAAIGPSHFMRLDLDDRVLERVWKRSVLPSLADYLHGAESRLREFELSTLCDELAGAHR